MKRIIALFVSLIIVCACCVINASAADSYDLVPKEGSEWRKQDHGGASVTVDYQEDGVVFSGSVTNTWPAVDYYYETEDRITVNVDQYSIVYDFSIQGGAVNINFYFTDGFGGSGGYTIANNTLGDVAYDGGSGDLYDGDLKGVIRLSDFVNSTKFLDSSTFPANMITADGEIIFTGIQVYSVNGGSLTIRKLAIVPNEEAGDPTGGENADESSEEPVESSEEAVESSAVIEESDASVTESTQESTVESAEESTDATTSEEEGLGVWLYVIIGAAVVVVVIVIVVIAKKKK